MKSTLLSTFAFLWNYHFCMFQPVKTRHLDQSFHVCILFWYHCNVLYCLYRKGLTTLISLMYHLCKCVLYEWSYMLFSKYQQTQFCPVGLRGTAVFMCRARMQCAARVQCLNALTDVRAKFWGVFLHQCPCAWVHVPPWSSMCFHYDVSTVTMPCWFVNKQKNLHCQALSVCTVLPDLCIFPLVLLMRVYNFC